MQGRPRPTSRQEEALWGTGYQWGGVSPPQGTGREGKACAVYHSNLIVFPVS